jgi:hypothetical protein
VLRRTSVQIRVGLELKEKIQDVDDQQYDRCASAEFEHGLIGQSVVVEGGVECDRYQETQNSQG